MSESIRNDEVLVFPKNEGGKDYFCGDVHGCYDDLMASLSGVAFDCSKDRLFCVGDLVDRGPESLRCLDLIYEPWFYSVRGNHEVMMAEALDSGDHRLWRMNGGAWSLACDGFDLRPLVNDAMAIMPLAIEVVCEGGRRIGVIHADVTSGEWGVFDERRDVWSRDRIQGPLRFDTPGPGVSGIDAVVVGHTILNAPVVRGNVVHIDTGSFATGKITVLSAEQVLGMAE